jgi:hypothetical protein
VPEEAPSAEQGESLSEALTAAAEGDDDLRRQLVDALRGSDESRRAIVAEMVRGGTTKPPADAALPAVPVTIGRKLVGDPLGRWRRGPRRSLVIIGDSIANQCSRMLRSTLRDGLPGGTSFGYAGLAGGTFASWQVAGEWDEVGATGANLGLPTTPSAARRSPGGAGATLTWTRPPGWTVDDAELHWVDDAGSGPAFSYRIDDGSWIEVPCAAPTGPVARRTSVGPVMSQLVVRAARADGSGLPSPVFLGLDARDHRAANVVHALTFPGGTIASRAGSDSDACLRPDRLDVALAHLEQFEPSLILWETINDARSLDLDRLETAIAAVQRALPAAEHAAMCVYEVVDSSAQHVGQDELHRYLAGRFDAVVDFHARWGRPADAIAAGLLAPDGIHPTARRGSGDLAAALAGMLATDAEP